MSNSAGLLLARLVSLIALSGLHRSLRVSSDVLRERAAHIIYLIKASFLIASDVALVRASVDQFSITALLLSFRCHCPFLPLICLLASGAVRLQKTNTPQASPPGERDSGPT